MLNIPENISNHIVDISFLKFLKYYKKYLNLIKKSIISIYIINLYELIISSLYSKILPFGSAEKLNEYPFPLLVK